MNATQLADNGMNAEVVKKDKAPVWRVVPVVLGIIAIFAVGLLVVPPGANTAVWVHFLGHRFVVARGGVPATIAPMLLLLIAVLIPAWALINAVRTPRSTFAALGLSKGRWVTAIVILFLIPDASLLIVPTYYLLRVRPQLHRQGDAILV